MYFDLRCKYYGISDASRHISIVIHDLHGNEVFVGLCKMLSINIMDVSNLFLKVFGFSNLSLHSKLTEQTASGLRRFRQICQKLCQFVSVNYKINYKWRRVKSSAELVGFGTKEI